MSRTPAQAAEAPKVQCSLNMPNGPQTTVGELFTMTCEGEMPTKLAENVQLVLPPLDPPDARAKHDLKLSRVVVNETGKTIGSELVLEVYSHRAGEFELPKLTITDGVTTYESGPIKWQIASVLQQGDEMNPPFGGVDRSYPLWFWGSILGVILLVAAIVIHFQRRARIRRQLIFGVLGEGHEHMPFRELVKMQNSQAYAQFSRDVRAIQKKLSAGQGAQAQFDPQEVWKDVDKAFRFYLVRELLTPAFGWSRRQILSDIKKHHRRVYNETSRELKQILQEFDKGVGQTKITLLDCEQLFNEARIVAQKIYQVRTYEAKRWRAL